MQEGSITINIKVKIDFILPDISATKIVTCNWQVYGSNKYRYDMILGRDLLIASGLNLKLSDDVIEGNYGPFKGSVAPMVDLDMFEFKYLNKVNISPGE